MKKSNILFLPLFVFAQFSFLGLKASVNFVDAALSEVRNMAAREGKLYFAHFSADWCMPCQWMEKNTFNDPQLAVYANQNYLATRLDIDHSEGQWYQNQYKVATLPTILIFSSQGVLLNRIETSVGAKELLSILEELNKPGNKISIHPPATRAIREPVMDSPKAVFTFSRPALIPEPETRINASQPVFARQSPVFASVEARHINTNNFQGEPLAFTPKSVAEYYIETGVFNKYEEAVDKVHLLEKDFNQPVMLYTRRADGQLFYHVTIGKFQSKTQAKDFLNFLQRNDVMGELREKS